jgi:hypothetical protein
LETLSRYKCQENLVNPKKDVFLKRTSIFVYGPIKVQRTREWLKKDCYNVQNNKGELVLLFQILKKM